MMKKLIALVATAVMATGSLIAPPSLKERMAALAAASGQNQDTVSSFKRKITKPVIPAKPALPKATPKPPALPLPTSRPTRPRALPPMPPARSVAPVAPVQQPVGSFLEIDNDVKSEVDTTEAITKTEKAKQLFAALALKMPKKPNTTWKRPHFKKPNLEWFACGASNELDEDSEDIDYLAQDSQQLNELCKYLAPTTDEETDKEEIELKPKVKKSGYIGNVYHSAGPPPSRSTSMITNNNQLPVKPKARGAISMLPPAKPQGQTPPPLPPARKTPPALPVNSPFSLNI